MKLNLSTSETVGTSLSSVRTFSRLTAAFLLTVVATSGHALAIHDSGLFTGTSLARNDDDSTSGINLGFSALINGTSYSTTYVNNNGNLTFGNSLYNYTPSVIQGNSFPIIAAFWADVDTRSGASGIPTFGSAVLNGRKVFGVNWIDVGYYNSRADKLNSFQLILTDRSDIATGDFDIQYNYDKIQWETGSASSSGGVNGLGGISAAVGYSVGTAAGNSYQLPGSFQNGAFLDGGVKSLTGNSLNSSVLGQYNFSVRSGSVTVVPSIPEPETYALLAFGLAAVGFASRHGRARAKLS
jgi:hypothetical protein